MPLIIVRVMEDVFSAEEKREVIDKLTDALVSIEGESMRAMTWVLIEEIRDGHWGIGGQGLRGGGAGGGGCHRQGGGQPCS